MPKHNKQRRHKVRGSGKKPRHAAPCCLELPVEVITRILTHVDLQQRLGTCSLVCTAWRAAAAAATTSLDLQLRAFPDTKARQLQGLVKWLRSCPGASTVSSLRLDKGPAWPLGPATPWDEEEEALCNLRELPCARLRHLQLEGCSVQLGADPDGFPGVLHTATGLTRLQLQDCTVLDGLQGAQWFSALSVMTALKHLQLQFEGLLLWERARMEGNSLGPISGCELLPGDLRLPGTVLQRLQQLTYLELDCWEVELQHASCLTALRDLRLPRAHRTTDQRLQHLQHLTGLTRLDLSTDWSYSYFLEMTGHASSSVVTPSPWLTRLTALRHLAIKNAYLAGLGPLLSGLTRLTVLDLSDSYPEPRTPAATEELLAGLPHLQQLVELRLCGFCLFDSCVAPAAAYSILTAMPHLACLDLTRAFLPLHVHEHLSLRLGRLQLTQLCLNSVCSDINFDTVFDTRDVERIVCGCPSLEVLWLEDAVLESATLTSLGKLSNLRSLRVNSPLLTQDTLYVLARLRYLDTLHVMLDGDEEPGAYFEGSDDEPGFAEGADSDGDEPTFSESGGSNKEAAAAGVWEDFSAAPWASTSNCDPAPGMQHSLRALSWVGDCKPTLGLIDWLHSLTVLTGLTRLEAYTAWEEPDLALTKTRYSSVGDQLHMFCAGVQLLSPWGAQRE